MVKLKLAKQLILYLADREIKFDIKRQKAFCSENSSSGFTVFERHYINLIVRHLAKQYFIDYARTRARKSGAFNAFLQVAFGIDKKVKIKSKKQVIFLADNELATLARQLATHRKFLQRRLVDEILSLRNTIKSKNVQMDRRVDFLAVKFNLCSTVPELYDHDGYK